MYKRFYADGIGFINNNYEIAFYSRITNRVTYNQYGIEQSYPDFKSYGSLSIPIYDNIEIIESIKEYLERGN